VPEPESLRILLDQNIPRACKAVFDRLRPGWTVDHARDVGLSGAPDETIAAWAAANSAIVITFDEDFADRRTSIGRLPLGVIRLRAHPTTVESANAALERVLTEVDDDALRNSLVVVSSSGVRVRSFE
jgi:predicted nuclease of predicted toxin-antitoxin system